VLFKNNDQEKKEKISAKTVNAIQFLASILSKKHHSIE